jgi:hypothetical protein
LRPPRDHRLIEQRSVDERPIALWNLGRERLRGASVISRQWSQLET